MDARFQASPSSGRRHHVTSHTDYVCAFYPEDLAEIAAVFEAAWKLIEGQLASGAARDSARFRLATLVLGLGPQRSMDAVCIEAVALAALNRMPN
jgi:hypothetical protein